MKHLSLQIKLLLLTLLPVILLSTLTTLYLTFSRIADIQELYDANVSAVSKQIAVENTTALFTRDYRALKNNVDNYFSIYNHLARVSVYTSDNEIFYNSQARPFSDEEVIHLKTPVLLSQSFSDFNDFPSLEPEPLQSADEMFDSGQLLGYAEVWIINTSLQEQKGIIQTSLAILFLVISFSLVIAIPVSKRIVTPINKLRDSFENVAGGDLSIRVKEDANDELLVLQKGFNEMTYALSRQNEELNELVDQMTADLQTSLQTVEIQNVELDIARRQAIDSSRIKSEFLASMSHEIRTPMNAIVGYADILKKSHLSDQGNFAAEIISSSAHNLLGILNDILDYSKLEAGKIELNPQPFSLQDCIQDICQIFSENAFRKKLNIVPILYNDLPDEVIADPLRLSQIIGNLLSNAIKFSEDNDIIVKIMLGEQEFQNGAEIIISVIDRGIGISEQGLRQLFTPFHQLRNNQKRIFGGTGLGLTISKALADIMKARIEVTSEEGRGTTFKLTLPVGLASEQASIPHNQTSGIDFSGKRVLLLENREISRRAHENLLSAFNVNTQTSHFPVEVEQLQLQEPLDLVILSLSTQDLASIDKQTEFLGKLREMKLPLLVLTASNEEAIVSSIKSACQCDILSRPVFARQLAEILSAMWVSGYSKSDQHKGLTEQDKQLKLVNRYLTGKKLLVVDDNDINRHLITMMLAELDCEVAEAASGAQAIELSRLQKFDIILMDIHMPEMNGIEATQEIRKITHGIPVFALTADIAFRDHRDESQLFDGILIKPVDVSTIISSLELFFSGETVSTQGKLAIDKPDNVFEQDELIYDATQALRITGGSQEVANELLGQLIRQIPEYLVRINRNQEEENWEQLWQTLHKLHGAVAVCGTPALKKAINQLQKRIKNTDYLNIEKHVSNIKNQADALINYYNKNIRED
jgi:two-component system sensor histidine kinase BarA